MQSLSLECNSTSISQNISCSLLNQKVHCCVYKAPQLSHTLSRWIKSTFYYLFPSRHILILFSQLYICLSSGLFSSGFSHQNSVHILFYSMCATCSTQLNFLDTTILIYYIWRIVYQQLQICQWFKSIRYNETLLHHFWKKNSTYSSYSPRKHLKTLFCNCVLKLIFTLLEQDLM